MLYKLHKLSLLKQHIEDIGNLSQKSASYKAVSRGLRTKAPDGEM